jgi:hypothetical protein
VGRKREKRFGFFVSKSAGEVEDFPGFIMTSYLTSAA